MKCKIHIIWYMKCSDRILWKKNLFEIDRRFSENHLNRTTITKEERMRNISVLMKAGIRNINDFRT